MRLSTVAFLTVQISFSAFAASAPAVPGVPWISDGSPAWPYAQSERLRSTLAAASWTESRERRRRAAIRVGHWEAWRHLRVAGVKRRSTGHCADRRGRSCTSLESIRVGTVEELIRLKRRSHCRIVLTGGTERGHAPGRYSHGEGYKVDVAKNRCLDRYITGSYRFHKVRGDGTRTYRSGRPPHDDIYAREWNHWDILFR